MHENRTYKLLIVASFAAAALLGMALLRTAMVDCPDGCGRHEILCLFVPTDMDLGTHLMSYAFFAALLLSTGSGLLLWHRQMFRIRQMTSRLTRLQTQDDSLVPLLKRLQLTGRVLVADAETPFCFCTGFFAPRIYLSTGMLATLTSEELEAILIHERHHLLNRVPLKLFLGRFLTSIIFFLPFLRDLLERYALEEEIAADESAIRRQGHRRGIAGALEKLVSRTFANPLPGLAAGATDALACRIDHLAGQPADLPHHVRISRLLIGFTAYVVMLTAALHPVIGSHTVAGHIVGFITLFPG